MAERIDYGKKKDRAILGKVEAKILAYDQLLEVFAYEATAEVTRTFRLEDDREHIISEETVLTLKCKSYEVETKVHDRDWGGMWEPPMCDEAYLENIKEFRKWPKTGSGAVRVIRIGRKQE